MGLGGEPSEQLCGYLGFIRRELKPESMLRTFDEWPDGWLIVRALKRWMEASDKLDGLDV